MAWPWQKTEGDSREALLRDVTLAIEKVIGHPGGITHTSIQPTASLGADLGLTSIAVARLTGLLQKRCGGKPLPFHKLFVKPDGTMMQDIRVSDVVSFLDRHLNGTAS